MWYTIMNIWDEEIIDFAKLYIMGMTLTTTSITSISYTSTLLNHSSKWDNENEEFRITDGMVAFL